MQQYMRQVNTQASTPLCDGSITFGFAKLTDLVFSRDATNLLPSY